MVTVTVGMSSHFSTFHKILDDQNNNSSRTVGRMVRYIFTSQLTLDLKLYLVYNNSILPRKELKFS